MKLIIEPTNEQLDSAEQQYQNDVNAAWQQSDEEQTINAIAHAAPKTFTEALLQMSTSEMVAGIVESVESGMIDPLKALVAIKKLQALADTATNKDPKKNKHADLAILLNTHIMEGSAKYAEKKFSAFGVTFTKTEVGTKYDWSVCNDPKLVALEKAAKDAADALKQRQEMLKTLPDKGIIETDETTGETTTIYRPATTSTSAVSVSFK